MVCKVGIQSGKWKVQIVSRNRAGRERIPRTVMHCLTPGDRRLFAQRSAFATAIVGAQALVVAMLRIQIRVVQHMVARGAIDDAAQQCSPDPPNVVGEHNLGVSRGNLT